LGKLRQARSCMLEATKRARDSWKMFDSFVGLCMQLRDIQGCLQGLRRLVELNMVSQVDDRTLGTITMAVVNDKDGLFDKRTGAAFAPMLSKFFEFLTANHTSEPFIWQFYAILQDFQGQRLQSLESRFKQARASQARLWELQDPERFTDELNELSMCFQALDALLEDPDLVADAPKHLQPLAYSVRNCERRLKDKLQAAIQPPEDWKRIAEELTSLARVLEARAEKAGGNKVTYGYTS